MKHSYLYSFLLVILFVLTVPAVIAQEKNDTTRTERKSELPIEGLSIYPNPVTGNKVYISTSKNLQKEIEIFNTIGKSVKKTRIRGKELDVSSLKAGLYIIKISEERGKATRKLIIR